MGQIKTALYTLYSKYSESLGQIKTALYTLYSKYSESLGQIKNVNRSRKHTRTVASAPAVTSSVFKHAQIQIIFRDRAV